MATIDYMIASYGINSTSATGGNALARDFLSCVASLHAGPFCSSIGKTETLGWATITFLGCLAFIVIIPIYLFYWKSLATRL